MAFGTSNLKYWVPEVLGTQTVRGFLVYSWQHVVLKIYRSTASVCFQGPLLKRHCGVPRCPMLFYLRHFQGSRLRNMSAGFLIQLFRAAQSMRVGHNLPAKPLLPLYANSIEALPLLAGTFQGYIACYSGSPASLFLGHPLD